MKTLEEKLSKLEKAIQNEIIRTKNIELGELEDIKKEEFEKYEFNMKRKIKNLKDEYSSKREFLNLKNENLVHNEGEEIITNTKNEIKQDIIKCIKVELKNKYISGYGEKYLEKILSSLRGEIEENSCFYVIEKTFDRDAQIINKYFPEKKVIKSNDIKLGGILIRNEENTYQMNFTLDFLFEENEQKIFLESKKLLNF